MRCKTEGVVVMGRKRRGWVSGRGAGRGWGGFGGGGCHDGGGDSFFFHFFFWVWVEFLDVFWGWGLVVGWLVGSFFFFSFFPFFLLSVSSTSARSFSLPFTFSFTNKTSDFVVTDLGWLFWKGVVVGEKVLGTSSSLFLFLVFFSRLLPPSRLSFVAGYCCRLAGLRRGSGWTGTKHDYDGMIFGMMGYWEMMPPVSWTFLVSAMGVYDRVSLLAVENRGAVQGWDCCFASWTLCATCAASVPTWNVISIPVGKCANNGLLKRPCFAVPGAGAGAGAGGKA